MTESSDTSDTPAKPQDYAGLRAELSALADDFAPVITELWPRLEDHKHRWADCGWANRQKTGPLKVDWPDVGCRPPVRGRVDRGGGHGASTC